MAETHEKREKISERQTSTPFPKPRTFVVGIYREKKKIVVRKFEEIDKIRICLDEQYALNIDDAVVIQNILLRAILS